MVAATCASASVTESSATSGGVEQRGADEIMLFGVRVVVDSMRKSVSLNNLSQYEQPQESGNNNNNNNNNSTKEDAVAGGYASADDSVPHPSGTRERKRGVPWTEEEHKLFLIGLKKVGKGDWRGISRNFVKTRTPTQVASHAQKYFLRRSNINRRRRRSSLFDITTDTVTAIPMGEDANPQENTTQSHALLQPAPETNNISGFSIIPAFPMTVNPVVFPVPIENPMENLSLGQGNQLNNGAKRPIRPVPVFPTQQAPTVSEINLNSKAMMDPSPLSLQLSLTSDQRDSPSRHSAFQVMPSFSNGDRNSIMGVA